MQLNLARKWRSKDFNHIIGQELPVKMLKNSLYLEHYFPVYLFSGQRGCGKTTTARVFAAAINCEQRTLFQNNPKKQVVPCLTCESCKAMLANRHPDFFEIDAASHTGVDNVRHIIDSASLLPLMGHKKIYLIDEAHMLSKAAFNAFLKILEEPPASVLFILATTELQKIIETVRSRCFHVFFKPVDNHTVVKHLKAICLEENIQHHDDALSVIAKETDGSVRDAINLLEQVRFACGSIGKNSVFSVLGYLDDEQIIQLFESVLFKKPCHVLQLLRDITFELYSAEFMWTRFILLTRSALWIKYGLEPEQFGAYKEIVQKLVNSCEESRLIAMWELFYNHEQTFVRTTGKHALLEMLFVQLCQNNDNDNSSNMGSAPQAVGAVEADCREDSDEEESDSDEEDDDEEESDDAQSYMSLWQSFLGDIEDLKDPLLNSIFKQGVFLHYDEGSSSLDVSFLKEFVFFKEWLENTETVWLPLLKKIFSETVLFNPLFTRAEKSNHDEKREGSVKSKNKAVEKKDNIIKKGVFQPVKKTRNMSYRHSNIDVSDSDTWKKTHMVLQYFPGTVSEIAGKQHE